MSSEPSNSFSETFGGTWRDFPPEMSTVTFGLASQARTLQRMEAAFRGEIQAPRIDFGTPELFSSIMRPERWSILRTMTGAGPMSLSELARRIERDIQDVEEDVRALLNCGVLDRDGDAVIFPFAAIHVDFVIEAAA